MLGTPGGRGCCLVGLAAAAAVAADVAGGAAPYSAKGGTPKSLLLSLLAALNPGLASAMPLLVPGVAALLLLGGAREVPLDSGGSVTRCCRECLANTLRLLS